MKNLFYLLFALPLFFSCGGEEDIKGVWYAGFDQDPDQFSIRFEEGGVVKICVGSLYDRSCCSEGKYTQDGKSFNISGIYNANCTWIPDLNGTYTLCESCIPKNSGYEKTINGRRLLVFRDKK